MNEIVRHYPARKLPADLREGLPEGAEVDITLVLTAPSGKPRRRLQDIIGTGQNVHGDEDEVLRHIRELREDR